MLLGKLSVGSSLGSRSSLSILLGKLSGEFLGGRDSGRSTRAILLGKLSAGSLEGGYSGSLVKRDSVCDKSK